MRPTGPQPLCRRRWLCPLAFLVCCKVRSDLRSDSEASVGAPGFFGLWRPTWCRHVPKHAAASPKFRGSAGRIVRAARGGEEELKSTSFGSTTDGGGPRDTEWWAQPSEAGIAVQEILSSATLVPVVESTAKDLRVYKNPLDLVQALANPEDRSLGMLMYTNWHEAPLENRLSVFQEMNLIRPSNALTLQHMYDLFEATKPLCRAAFESTSSGARNLSALPKLPDYVAFGRMTGLHPYDKLSCDWCSIVNGVGVYLSDLLRYHFAQPGFDARRFHMEGMPLQTLQRWLIRWHHHLPHTASALHAAEVPFERAESTVAVAEAIHESCQRICTTRADATREQQRIFELVRPILEMSWFGEAQEMRWCPFRHATDSDAPAMRLRPYYALDSSKKEELEQAFRLLREDGRVTCRHCAKKLDSLMADGSNAPVNPDDSEDGRTKKDASSDTGWANISPKLKPYYEELLKLHGGTHFDSDS